MEIHLWDVPGDVGQFNKARKGIKGIWLKKQKFAYDIIFYVENPKEYFLKLQELIGEFNNTAGYKQCTKSIVFLCTYRLVMNNWKLK